MIGLLAALTVTLQLADARSTLTRPGVELNPITRPLIHHPAALYTIKGGIGAGVGWSGVVLHRTHPKLAVWYLLTVNLVQGAVIVHNLRLGKEAR